QQVALDAPGGVGLHGGAERVEAAVDRQEGRGPRHRRVRADSAAADVVSTVVLVCRARRPVRGEGAVVALTRLAAGCRALVAVGVGAGCAVGDGWMRARSTTAHVGGALVLVTRAAA